MRYAIVGAGGMLGKAFVEHCEKNGTTALALPRADFDLALESPDFARLDDADVVINCAAYTNVDGAESDEEAARAVNGVGVGRLAEFCAKEGKKLVHFSTDYVFDGSAKFPYPVDHARAPLNAYGRSKALGEELLESSGADFLCLRTSWVYAPWGKNFVLTMKKLLAEKAELRVVEDQRGRPSSALELAKNTFQLLEAGAHGTFHLTDSGECSWFEFTLAIQSILGTKCSIVPCSSDEFPRPARRPGYSVLALDTSEALIGTPIDYRKALEIALKRA